MNIDHIEKLIADRLWRKRKNLRKTFIELDKDKSGLISIQEFTSGLSRMGCQLTSDEIKQVAFRYDTKNNGFLNYYELLSLVRSPLAGFDETAVDYQPEATTAAQIKFDKIRQLISEWADAFIHFDTDRTGVIGIVELAKGLKEMGVDLTADEMVLLTTTFDADNTGNLNYPEFLTLMCDSTEHSFFDSFGEREDYKQTTAVLPETANYATKYKADSEGDALVLMTKLIRSNDLRLRDLFKKFDRDGSKTIDVEEFNMGLKKLGVSLSGPALISLMKTFDTHGDGKIQYNEFLTVLSKAMAEPVKENKLGNVTLSEGDMDTINLVGERIYSELRSLRRAFKKMDTSGDGRLGIDELYKGISDVLYLDVPKDTIVRMVSHFDHDSDGHIQYSEFVNMISSSSV